MCGIVGWIKLEENDSKMSADCFANSLKECSTRGLDATGFYTPELGIWKYPFGANEFCVKKNNDLHTLANQDFLMGHCRSASKGKTAWASRDNNENNHPFEGERWVIVHNGWFGHLPRIKGYPYKGECDSEIFLSYLECFGLEEALSMQVSSDKFALVMYDKQDKRLYLYRHDKPIVYAFDTSKGMLVWGSTLTIVRCLEDNEFNYHGVRDGVQTTGWEMVEDTLFCIDDNRNLKKLNEIKPCASRQLRDKKFDKEMKLTEGLSMNEVRDNATKEEHSAVVYTSRESYLSRHGAKIKSSVFLTVGLVGNDFNQVLTMFAPIKPHPSDGALCRTSVM